MLIRKILAVLIALLLMSCAFFIWQVFDPVRTAAGWSYAEVFPNVRRAAALAVDAQGNLWVTEELKKQEGTILRFSKDGQKTVVLTGLSKPDGLALYQGGIIFSQESGIQPVQWLQKDGQLKTLFEGANLQSLIIQDDQLFVIEDKKKEGRLFNYDLKTQELRVVRNNLDEAGALAICPDGRRFYAEKDKGVVKELLGEGPDPIRLKDIDQPGSMFCDQLGLWISEDANHRARVLLWTPEGKLKVMLKALKSPQGVEPMGNGHYWLAEGGRNRVLEFKPKQHHSHE